MENYVKAFKNNNEPADKYGVHFEYKDLFQRLVLVKRQREKQNSNSIFKTFDKEKRKTPSIGARLKHKSKSSVRSNSEAKNPNRGLSTEFMKISKIYSPSMNKKISSPERFLGTIRLNKSILGTKSLKRRISRGRVYIS